MSPKEPISIIVYRAKEFRVSKDIEDLGDSENGEPLIRYYKCEGIEYKRSECPIKKLVRERARESIIGLQWPQELKEP